MVDHIFDGKKGQIGNKLKEFKKNSPPFKHIVAMCNAIKHVRVLDDGSREPVATVKDVTVADPRIVLFTEKINDSPKSFRPEREILILNYNDNGRYHKIWVGFELFCALLFVARELNCESLVHAEGLPDEVNLVYRDCLES